MTPTLHRDPLSVPHSSLSRDLAGEVRPFLAPAMVVNEYIAVTPMEPAEQRSFSIEAPMPGEGLRKSVIQRQTSPHLHSMLSALLENRAFSVPEDRGCLIRELQAAGVVITGRPAPVHPVLRCEVNDTALGTLAALAAGSTLPLEPAIEAALRFPEPARCFVATGDDWILWVDLEHNGVEWPIWMRADQAEQLRGAGPHAVSLPAPNGSDMRRARAELQARCASFIPRVIPDPILHGLQTYYRELVRNGFLRLGDSQSLRFFRKNEPMALWLHQQSLPIIRTVIPEPVKPSYSYLGIYIAGATLDRHTDRPQCEYTLSLTIDATPDPSSAGAWPLYADLPDGTILEALLGAGDALLFKGRELPHYRKRLPPERTSSSIFLHYVPASFDGELD